MGKVVSDDTKRKMSEGRKGNISSGNEIVIEGTEYTSMTVAGETLGLPRSVVSKRINSDSDEFNDCTMKKDNK